MTFEDWWDSDSGRRRFHPDSHYARKAWDAAVTADRECIAEAMRSMVRLMHLPDAPQYPGDERHTEKRMLLALADATVANSWPNV